VAWNRWEGFAHTALHQWCRDHSSGSGSSWSLQAISVSILHVAIHLISDDVLVFRKACLVAASSLPSETKDWLDKNQKIIFNELINKIDELASFKDSLEFLQLAVQRNENPFHWLRWLEHLNWGKGCARDNWNSDGVGRILTFIYEHKEDAEAVFADVKSKFCSEVLFDDAKEMFTRLYAMYKQARMQYLNGMLSLHY